MVSLAGLTNLRVLPSFWSSGTPFDDHVFKGKNISIGKSNNEYTNKKHFI